MASGRQVEYSLRLNSNASSVLMADSAAANKFDNSMWQVQKTLASFGVGLGAHFLIDAAKDWTQAAADYEQAMLRIKNASKTEDIGLFNEHFISGQVDKFKLKLQETVDAYGSFLFKMRNANLNNDVENRMFENITLISKVGGVSQEQIDAQVRNIGILMGEGSLEARHLRQLSYVDPQIVPFLAKALGLKDNEASSLSNILNKDVSEETASQQLSQMISSGKLTKQALSPNAIIEALELQRQSLETKLPETLDTVQSHLNSLSVTWERFKNSMILDQKPELLQLFHDLEGGIHWLAEHEESIIKIGKDLFEVIKLYAEWRIGILALEIPFGIFKFFTGEYTRLLEVIGLYTKASESLFGITTKQTLAYEYEATSIDQVTAALIRLKDIQAEPGFGYIRDASGNIVGTVSKESLLATSATETGEVSVISGGILGALSSTGAIALGIAGLTAATIYGLSKLSDEMDKNKKSDEKQKEDNYKINAYNSLVKRGIDDLNLNEATGGRSIDKYTFFAKRQQDLQGTELESALEARLGSGSIKSDILLNHIQEFYKDLFSDKNTLDLVTLKNGYREGSEEEKKRNLVYDFLSKEFEKFTTEDTGTKESKKTKISQLPEHHIRGNSSNYFTVNIHELNGIKQLDVKESSASDIQNIKQIVGQEITRNMLEIINDIQVVRNGH